VVIDDGRRPTRISRLIERVTRSSRSGLESPVVRPDDEPSPSEVDLPTEPHEEFEILIPAGTKIDPLVVPGLLSALASCGALCFEIVGSAGTVAIHFSAGTGAALTLLAQLHAFLPQAVVRSPESSLVDLWSGCQGESVAAIEFGLAREFMVPLKEIRA